MLSFNKEVLGYHTNEQIWTWTRPQKEREHQTCIHSKTMYHIFFVFVVSVHHRSPVNNVLGAGGAESVECWRSAQRSMGSQMVSEIASEIGAWMGAEIASENFLPQ